jgi:hypothetical protein
MQRVTYPTPPGPTSAIREAGRAHFSFISGNIPRSTKSKSRRNGTVDDGVGRGKIGSIDTGILGRVTVTRDQIMDMKFGKEPVFIDQAAVIKLRRWAENTN